LPTTDNAARNEYIRRIDVWLDKMVQNGVSPGICGYAGQKSSDRFKKKKHSIIYKTFDS